MAWLYLVVAGALEIVWAVALKYSQGFTRFVPGLISVVAMVLSMVGLSAALKQIPLGTAYAIWTGIGAAGSAILGMFLFSEPRDFGRILSLILIVTGVVGLKLLSR